MSTVTRQRGSARLASTTLEIALVLAIVLVAAFGVLRPALGPGGLGIGTGPVFGASPSVDVTLKVGDHLQVTTIPSFPATVGQVHQGDAFTFLIPTRTQLVIDNPNLRQRVAFVGRPIFTGLITIGVLALLLLMTRTLRRGDPFVPVNARRMYGIAALVGLGGQLVMFVSAWGVHGVLQNPRVAPYVVQHVHVTYLPLLAGLAITVAAEVFRQGTRLRNDLDGLV